MTGLNAASWVSRCGVAAAAAALGIAAWIAAPAPASAQFFFGFPRFYAPYPYYSYPAPAYYPYYPPPAYPPPAYYPPPAPGGTPAPGAPATAAGMTPTAASIAYTDKPAFRNATGQTCREFRVANGTLGTACQDSSGQWRVAN